MVVALAPGEEMTHSLAAGWPGVAAADVGGEELDAPKATHLPSRVNRLWQEIGMSP